MSLAQVPAVISKLVVVFIFWCILALIVGVLFGRMVRFGRPLERDE